MLARVLAAVASGSSAEQVAAAACADSSSSDSSSSCESDSAEARRSSASSGANAAGRNGALPTGLGMLGPPSHGDGEQAICRCGVNYPHPCGAGTVRQLHTARCGQRREQQQQQQQQQSSSPHRASAASTSAGADGIRRVASALGLEHAYNHAPPAPPAQSASSSAAAATAASCCCPLVCELPLSLTVNAAWERLFGWSQSELLQLIERHGCKRTIDSMMPFPSADAAFRPLLSMLLSPRNEAAFDVDIVNKWGVTVRTNSYVSMKATQGECEEYTQTWQPCRKNA
jgi:hypothetical protein